MEKKKKSTENRELQIVMYFFMVLFLGMVAYFVYFQVVKSDSFINNPYNKLQDIFSKTVKRGDIKSKDGQLLATTLVNEDKEESRVYPFGRMTAHIVGYATNGKAGIENQENFSLLSSHEFFLNQIGEDLRGEKRPGDTVVLNLDMELQECAYDALGNYDGAVIVLEPKTGKILAMVSKPDFNPNTIEAEWDNINAEGSTVLFNRATQGSYTPGSVFKIFTTMAYHRQHPLTYNAYEYECKGEMTQGGKTIHCASNQVHGKENLLVSFANSCNTSFANLGGELDYEEMQKQCEELLFNQNLPIKFESSKSTFALTNSDSKALAMETVIGQGKTTVSPLHMVLVAGAISQKGKLMTPYLVDHIENVNGTVVKTNKPKEYGRIISKKEAKLMKDYLRTVVTDGTGGKLLTTNYDAYGKTGTAQVSDTTDTTNAWFVGFASKEGKKDIAIAVVVENSGSGSSYAVPIARKVFDLYFER